MKVLLDTHTWLWWLLRDPSMPDLERKALNAVAEERGIGLPAICLWEAHMLHGKGRIQLPIPFETWVRRAAAPDVLAVVPLDVDLITAVDSLPKSFHGDPADRMIVATARLHGLPLATRDKAIRKSRLVRIWKP